MSVDAFEIEAGDFTFTAHAAGPADGRLVLFLHGFPQSSFEWRHQMAALAAAGYRAVAFDQRGYSPGAPCRTACPGCGSACTWCAAPAPDGSTPWWA